DADAFVVRLGRFARPEGDQDVIPLVFQDVREFGRPGTGDPVGRFVAGGTAGTAAEGADRADAELGGQANGGVMGALVPAGQVGVGVDGVAVTGQGADFQPVAGDIVPELLPGGAVGQQRFSVQQWTAGVDAAGELDGPQAEFQAQSQRPVPAE